MIVALLNIYWKSVCESPVLKLSSMDYQCVSLLTIALGNTQNKKKPDCCLLATPGCMGSNI